MDEPEPELPPFSFSKKPVTVCHDTPPHSAISEIIPSSAISREPQITTPLIPGTTTRLYNNIDYDEQIRAPRMNNANYYTYQNANANAKAKHGGSISSMGRQNTTDSSPNISETSSTEPTKSHEEGGNEVVFNDNENDTDDDKYSPATFDLTQPTRRFSAPSNSQSDESPKTTILNYTTNNYIYERNNHQFGPNNRTFNNQTAAATITTTTNNDSAATTVVGSNKSGEELDPIAKQKLLKALDNLENNTTTHERKDQSSRIRNRPQNFNLNHHLSNRSGTELQQVYELKKPLCIPAVLRPTALNQQSPDSTETQATGGNSNGSVSSSSTNMSGGDTSPELSNLVTTTTAKSTDGNSNSPTTPFVDIKAYPFPSMVVVKQPSTDEFSTMTIDTPQAKEPTHEHWKPNNFTSNCMKCFDPFGNFFTPQRKRRHHCRFCGFIFCFDCLWHAVGGLDFTELNASGSTSTSTNATNSSNNSSNTTTTTSNNNNNININTTPTPGMLLRTVSNTSMTSKTTDSVGGVLLDGTAKFVIPIFSELQKQEINSSIDSYFKYCKVCRDCGGKYQKLVTDLNNEENGTGAPFVFVENPYLLRSKKGNSPVIRPSDSRQRLIERGRQMSGITENDLPERDFDPLQKSQISNVPSDWNWSSF
ncbi:hypothetical protein CAAN1_11S01090 [[Candida] anglica]|uniref:FYVE-type domain-containing protein n=1 Tax=[Candida] anglica TaxID=148631 RepID=A0ABP0ELT2_9ASCO